MFIKIFSFIIIIVLFFSDLKKIIEKIKQFLKKYIS